MEKYILDLINHDIKITKGLIEGYEEKQSDDYLIKRAKKRLPVLKKKLIKITEYKEQLDKLL